MSAEQLQNIQQAELNAVMGPYVTIALGLLVLWLVISFVDMPKVSTKTKDIELVINFSE